MIKCTILFYSPVFYLTDQARKCKIKYNEVNLPCPVRSNERKNKIKTSNISWLVVIFGTSQESLLICVLFSIYLVNSFFIQNNKDSIDYVNSTICLNIVYFKNRTQRTPSFLINKLLLGCKLAPTQSPN